MELDSVLLKTVVLYFETLSDIIVFVCVNKKCLKLVQTMSTNSYKLMSKHPIDQIIKIFPQIETLILVEFPQTLTGITLQKVSNIEINQINFDENNPRIYPQWFSQKLKKVRLYSEEIECLGNNIFQFINLTSLVIVRNMDNMPEFHNSIFTIMEHQSLKNFVLFDSICNIMQLINFEFENHKNTEYTFVLEGITDFGETPDFKVFTELPENVVVFTNFLCKASLICKMKFSPFDSFKDCGLLVHKDMGGHELYIEEMIQKCLTDKVDVISFNSQNDYFYDQMEDEKMAFNFKKSKYIKRMWVEFVDNCEIVAPKQAREINILYSKADFIMDESEAENIKIVGYAGKELVVNDKKLVNFECQRIESRVNFIHNERMFQNTFIFNFDVNKKCVVKHTK
ncbi:hypothetical protein EIN_062440 [Entamoeba invadens IP1]|uniref:hypothetical protein n=1 Tax=Entamoeba invadens IP1 TaxID=370355 RepID=UPI0002C3EE6E|nr:hypothetical protein EIN_062440 [Entamoeba invadens IP1]ELP93569.1 hypothetical protein EIN_062440 [Entamoeba invadens IP1]|eukprot:XP_004260340.1 hypothetical protein EIN_062440 [Entamoeba invadens IP1]